MNNEILRMQNILLKNESGCQIINGNFSVIRNEIMALIGLNNSGHMKMIDILIEKRKKDSGYIFYNENRIDNQLKDMKIIYVDKDTEVNNKVSIGDNIFITNRNRKGVIVKRGLISRATREILKYLHPELDPEQSCEKLSVAQKHAILMYRALVEEQEIFILNNISVLYNEEEVKKFKKIIKFLKDSNKTVILVYNNLNNIIKIADRITIMRSGITVKVVKHDDYNEKEVSKMLMGSNTYANKEMIFYKNDNAVIGMKNFKIKNMKKGINLTLNEGELVNIIDTEGKLYKKFIDCLLGDDKESYVSGNVVFDGNEITNLSKNKYLKQKIRVIPEDAINNCLFNNLDIVENILITNYGKVSSDFGVVKKRLEEYVLDDIKNYDESIKGLKPGRDINKYNLLVKYSIIFERIRLNRPKVVIIINPFAYNDEIIINHIYRKTEQLLNDKIGVIILTSLTYKFPGSRNLYLI